MHLTLGSALLAAALAGGDQVNDREKHFLENYRQMEERDAFAVFDHPDMLRAAEAEEQKMVFSRDLVIGIAAGGEAKAYPVPIMGTAELGNDTIGGVPVAVSW